MTLHARIESAIRTAKQWESDPSLLSEIRASLVHLFDDLVPEQTLDLKSRCDAFLGTPREGERVGGALRQPEGYGRLRGALSRNDDIDYEGDDLLLKRLTYYFKVEVMTWVNAPPCANPQCKGNEDGKQMSNTGTRGPESEEEKRGGASRVETYTCQLCNTPTTFPRYNSPRALFTSRRGRCGEYANLFGAYCRAVGFDTRYCLDLTDHVWTEVWSVRQGRWLHADSCEGLIDRPNMYEQGWGKKLSYVIGATHDSVTDITKRYTRKFFTDEFQTRRREFSPDENTSDRAFLQMNSTLKQMTNIPKGRMEELEKRRKVEDKFFGLVQSSGVWDIDYKEGRISGSHAWKAVRGELGERGKKSDGSNADEDKEKSQEASFLVESFYPAPHPNILTISIKSPSRYSHQECIIVNGVPCASTLLTEMNLPTGISIVVVDELSGCILQSRAFSSWASVGLFADTIPKGRIVALFCIDQHEVGEVTSNLLQRVGGLIVGSKALEGTLMFVGQAGFHPKWARRIVANDTSVRLDVSIQLNISPSLHLKLRTETNTAPALVSTRLPESIMPLKSQMAATEYQKRVAFEAFMKQSSDWNSTVVGYTTRPEAPIYLIGNESFPFRRADGPIHDTGSNSKSWATYHYLPDALVPDDDVITDESKQVEPSPNNATMYDIPVADDYFMGLLGSELLTKTGASSTSPINTVDALANTRLVALYFSAHWCGPCRGFTPMLIEFYNYLKEEAAPTHGLEIVFVSSDRSETEFQQYYAGMPFKAIPFANRGLAQQIKSVFGVRGIPSLVVIDSLSGRIVVSPDDSRREVHQACNMGEQAIERLFKAWLDQTPEESKAMLDILALSCEEAENSAGGDLSKAAGSAIDNHKANEYLIRKKEADTAKDPAALVKVIFTELVAKGMSPNEAAAEAIKRSAQQQSALSEGTLKMTNDASALPPPPDTSISIEKVAEAVLHLNGGDKSKVTNILTVAKKYVTNVQKDPTNPRFRTFRLSNKVFDQITSAVGSIQLLTCIGFSFFPSEVDFVASIPLSVDLKTISDVLDKALAV